MAGKGKKTEKLEKTISPSDRAFIDEYISNGYNATQAYLKVHPKSGYESARASGSRLLTFDNIKQALEREFEARTMKKAEVLSRLSDQARGTHYHFIEVNKDDGSIYFDFSSPEAMAYLHLIKKIKTKRNRRILGKGEDAEAWESEWVEVELHDPQAALKLIGEHEGIFKKDEGDGEKFTAPQIVELIKTYEKRERE